MGSFTTIIILAVGAVLGYVLGRRFAERRHEGAPANEAETEKQRNKDRIMALFESQDEIRNSDAQELLDISDSTVTRYFDELEEEGKVEQHGDRKSAFYTKK